MKPIALSIFFPTYNEEENIAASVRAAVKLAEASPFINDYEVIVVNDGSSDRTREIADTLAQAHPRVRAVHHEVNKGAGAAIATGFAAATKEYVFYTDADLQFDILEIQNLIIHLSEKTPVVIGYRAPRSDPFMRLVNAKGWNVLMRLFFGLRVRDVDCAFKIFRTDLVQDLKLQSGGAMTLAETLIRLDRSGVTFKQVPVTHLPRVAGSATGANLSVIVRAFREMLMLYRGELSSVSQKQAFMFMSVGVVNTLVDLSVYLVLTRGTTLFVDNFTTAKFFSFLAGTITSFLLNRYWTFNITSAVRLQEVLRFYSVVSLSLVTNLAVVYVLTSIFGIYDLIAVGVATVFTFAVSFSLSRAWVFMKKTPLPSSRENQIPRALV